ncbi:hypothetical protein E2C01_045847 [Portunus trituberculatus]|uniref:Uncharacterized protein n=1 Tax=Portunus trituberculatus TaxID=210409 RepID=A0A5B7G337_PORTR|nr:hypothetical protein [Portunus trituberculatus]
MTVLPPLSFLPFNPLLILSLLYLSLPSISSFTVPFISPFRLSSCVSQPASSSSFTLPHSYPTLPPSACFTLSLLLIYLTLYQSTYSLLHHTISTSLLHLATCPPPPPASFCHSALNSFSTGTYFLPFY